MNVAIRDPEIAARLTCDFDADIRNSHEISFAEWRKRPVWEKLIGTLAWLLERQQ
jgi:phosphatidylserine/phosphatidylglycerophosphate/cardiolipin synthase-like enzyme